MDDSRPPDAPGETEQRNGLGVHYFAILGSRCFCGQESKDSSPLPKHNCIQLIDDRIAALEKQTAIETAERWEQEKAFALQLDALDERIEVLEKTSSEQTAVLLHERKMRRELEDQMDALESKAAPGVVLCGHVDEIECDTKHPYAYDVPPAAQPERAPTIDDGGTISVSSVQELADALRRVKEREAELIQRLTEYPERGEKITLHRELVGSLSDVWVSCHREACLTNPNNWEHHSATFDAAPQAQGGLSKPTPGASIDIGGRDGQNDGTAASGHSVETDDGLQSERQQPPGRRVPTGTVEPDSTDRPPPQDRQNLTPPGETGGGAMNRLPPIDEGAWVNPIRRGYQLQCCKCGAIHRVNFRLVKKGRGREIQFQLFRAKP